MTVSEMVLNLVSPEGVLFSGPFDSLSLPAWDGLRGILRGHAPLVGRMGLGLLVVKSASGSDRFGVYGGFYQISAGSVEVVVDRADVPSKLDPARCREEYEALSKPRRRKYDEFDRDETARRVAKIRLDLAGSSPRA